MDTPSIAENTPLPVLACPSCNGPVDVKSRHVAVSGSAVRIYCSENCQEAWALGLVGLPATPDLEPPPTPRWPHVLSIALGLGLLAPGLGDLIEGRGALPIGAARAAAVYLPPPAPTPATIESADAAAREAALLAEQKLEAVWVADLMQDAWFHPLAGPTRLMPRNHTQAFGAERPGDRPPGCVSGHCGVDVGGGLWGEPVHAAHDGVVARVNRGPNEEHGGVYVRIAHRDGTVFTQYFHLAAVPRWINTGTRVEAGQVIGLLGDTGVKHSAPHLHFTISVKPSRTEPERYLDPEPLLAIWPLWVDDGAATAPRRASTREPPGVPVRARQQAKRQPPTIGPADSTPSAGAAPVPVAPVDAAPPALAPPARVPQTP